MDHHRDHHLHDDPARTRNDHAGKVKDPVCGMWVDPTRSSQQAEHAGQTFHFCIASCRAKVLSEPERYLRREPDRSAASSGSAKTPADGVIYTCPMHPQIRQIGPGSCPICGMALEPLTATAETGPNPELIDMTRRFWVGLVLSLPVLALEMGGHLTGLDHYVPRSVSNWVQMALATPVVLWAGWPF